MQQQLNDYRTAIRFYQGSLINLTTSPIHLVDKLLIDFNAYNEEVSCIQLGFSFNQKVICTEQACMFQTKGVTWLRPVKYDVEPSSTPFIGRGVTVGYTYEIDINNVNLPISANSNEDIDDYLTVDAEQDRDSSGDIEVGKYTVTAIGVAGSQQRQTIVFRPAIGYDAAVTDFAVTGNHPEWAENINLVK